MGLFHYEKRIISTLRKKHIDYFDAITDLLAAMYVYCPSDYEKLLSALKDGSLSPTGKKYSSSEISALKGTRVFRDRYAKYLRKQMNEQQTIIQMLDDWFCRYKVTSSDPINRPAQGRLDPIKMVPLFTEETKTAVDNCKEKAQYLADPLPFEDMYEKILPNPNASHSLIEYLSKRGESKLEAFHDRFAHYANCGMRNSLADNLNLAGTARYNLAIRHKRSLIASKNPDIDQRKKTPAAWERVVPYFNHTELWYVNRLATEVGCSQPFPKAEVLPHDTGERFFSEYLTSRKQLRVTYGELGQCLCQLCSNSPQPEPENAVVVPQPTERREDVVANPENTVQTTPPRPLPNLSLLPNLIANSINTYAASSDRAPPIQRLQAAPSVPIQRARPSIAPLIPMQYQLPLYFVAPCFPPPCCDKYKQWMTRRVGRPPHHPLCTQR